MLAKEAPVEEKLTYYAFLWQHHGIRGSGLQKSRFALYSLLFSN
jgi:hypothetical protein